MVSWAVTPLVHLDLHNRLTENMLFPSSLTAMKMEETCFSEILST